MSIKLRPWQDSAINRALKWLVIEKKDKRFLINAAPGAGKTICASVIAKKLIEINEIEKVIVIAPKREVVKQWKEEFRAITNRIMLIETGSNKDDMGLDLCSTWNSVESNLNLFQTICEKYKTLVVCDEHHHAAINAVWGNSANQAFDKSKFVIVLTGTPIRTDGLNPVWFNYSEDGGQLTHPQEGTYTLTYGEAVDLKYCRPAFFHRHEGKFTVVLKEGGETLAISGSEGVKVDEKKYEKKLSKVLQKSLDYYTLARSPQYKKDGKTPDVNSYQASMLEWGITKLEETKQRLPKAGGLVIAPNIKVAEYMAELLEILTEKKPMIVHSKTPNAEDKIDAFRHSDKDWLVSVAMISEGVDIKRLRVLVYLPNAQTELSFRQAIGRVVRSMGDEDDSRAYVIMPTHSIFEEYARRIEREMLAAKITNDSFDYLTKICPKCENECNKNDKVCNFCKYNFPDKKIKSKICNNCKKENNINAEFCTTCNEKFGNEYIITLDTALRMGGIARELDIDEEEVRYAEKYYKDIRKEILESGDARVIEVLSIFPEESLLKLKKILDKFKN
jgi:superfamily II DNA or RNA helicase